MADDPTYNEAAERAVLGSILMSKGSVIPEVLEHIRSDMFWKPKHQIIFEACLTLYAEQDPVNEVTVVTQLQKDGSLNRVGGGPYVIELVQATPTAANATFYAKAIAETFKLRQLGQLCSRGNQLIREGGGDYQEIVAQFEQFLDESELIDTPNLEGFGDIFDEWSQWQRDPLDAMASPWPRLNDVLAGGFHKQRLYIIGARPGCGKSVCVLNSAVQMAMQGKRGIIFSLEMPKMEVMSRMVAAGARVPYGEITRHLMSRDTFDKVHNWQSQFPEFNSRIMINDESDLTMERIAQISRNQKRRGLDFIFIDYVQLLNTEHRSESRYRELGEMSRMAKVLSRKLDISVTMAAQLNRDPEKQSRLPSLIDLRESGNLEADADAVVMLSRGSDAMPGLPMIKMSVVKNRTGENHVNFDLPEHFEWQRIGE